MYRVPHKTIMGKKNSCVTSVFLDIDITQVIKITYRYGLDDCGASFGRPV